jgi:CRISPR/Cas system-associated exonuclease Cas4 (RecB family)
MDYGRYFETLVIGGSAHDEGLTELPLTKTGKKTADNERIDLQAEYAKQMLFNKEHEHYLNFIPENYQVNIYNSDINYRGTLDIMGTGLDGRPVIADLKLTSDIESTFGPYQWGNPEAMDFLQQVLYSYLYESTFKIRPRNLLLVYDFSPKMGKKVLEIEVTDNSYEALFNRIESFEEAIKHYNEKGYTKYPSLKECEGCPFEEIKCDTPFTVDAVTFEKITV